eukprot:g35746.t1
MLLLPAYNKKLKCEDQAQKVVECWSEVTDKLPRNCLELMDWSIWTILKNSAANLNEYATTVTDFITSQIALIRYCRNRSTADAICLARYSSLEHLHNKNTYVKFLFIDFNSAFN